jgi:hypothetical protein
MSRLGTLAFKVPIKVPALGTVLTAAEKMADNFRSAIARVYRIVKYGPLPL